MVPVGGNPTADADWRSDRATPPPALSGLTELWRVFTRYWKLSLIWSLVAMTLTALTTSFLMERRYRAYALIEAQQEDTAFAKLLGMPGRSASAAFQFAGNIIPGMQSAAAQELVTILNSFAFSKEVITHLNLTPILTKPSMLGSLWPDPAAEDPEWSAYKGFQLRFGAEYSYETNSITIWYLDTDRKRAVTVLQGCIDRLRQVLEKRQAKESAAAFEAIQAATEALSDPILKSRLYELLAAQIETGSIASAQSDYIFRVLEPPIAPPEIYSPKTVLDTLAAGGLCFVAGVLTSAFLDGRQKKTLK